MVQTVPRDGDHRIFFRPAGNKHWSKQLERANRIMSSIKMQPPAFDTDLYRSGPSGANKAVKNFMFKFRGWAQATTISTKLGQGGETTLAWVCITNTELRHDDLRDVTSVSSE